MRQSLLEEVPTKLYYPLFLLKQLRDTLTCVFVRDRVTFVSLGRACERQTWMAV